MIYIASLHDFICYLSVIGLYLRCEIEEILFGFTVTLSFLKYL